MFDYHVTVPNNLMLMLQNVPDLKIVTPNFIAIRHEELEMPVLIPGDFNISQSEKYWELYLETELKKLNAKLPA